MDLEKPAQHRSVYRKLHQRTSDVTPKWKPRFSREQEIKKFGYCSITTPSLVQESKISPTSKGNKMNDSSSMSHKYFSRIQKRAPINIASLQISEAESKSKAVRPSTAIMKKSRLASLIERTHKHRIRLNRSNTNENLTSDVHESEVYHKGTISKDEISSSLKPTTIAFGNNITTQTGKEFKAKSHKKRCRSSYNKIAQILKRTKNQYVRTLKLVDLYLHTNLTHYYGKTPVHKIHKKKVNSLFLPTARCEIKARRGK